MTKMTNQYFHRPHLKKFGSDWGGWSIDASLIRDDSYVMSVGLAHDISFDIELMDFNKTLKIIGIDPTESSKKTVRLLSESHKNRYLFIDKALYPEKIKVRLGGEASSILTPTNGIECETVQLDELLNEYDISIIKMDIEGSEYSIIESLNSLNVDQFCIEWHHWLNGQDIYTID